MEGIRIADWQTDARILCPLLIMTLPLDTSSKNVADEGTGLTSTTNVPTEQQRDGGPQALKIASETGAQRYLAQRTHTLESSGMQ